VYYGATRDLEPDPQELSELAGARCRALVIIHVLGFPRDAAKCRRWCDERGLLLIEDAAHAWSATFDQQPVGSFGDLSIFCPYKTLPLPSISAAVYAGPVPSGVDTRRRSSGLAWHQALTEEPVHPLRVTNRRLPVPAADRNNGFGDPSMRPSKGAIFLLSRLADHDPGAARRENYRLLLEQLGDLVPKPFDELPPGASPLAFPVAVPDKAALIDRLASVGIGAVDFWANPHPSVDADGASTTVERRRSTVVLPVHQRLSVDDLDRIAEAVRPPRRRHESFVSERVDDLGALRAEWSALAAETGNVFATWEWNQTWWAHFGRDRPLSVTALRDAHGALRGVLPLFLWAERPLRVARFLGHGAGDQLGPICAPGDTRAVSRAIRDLFRDARWDVLLGEQLPAEEAWGKRLAGRTLSREGSPTVRFRGTWSDTTSAWSRRLLKELRRDERRLREDHDVTSRVVSERRELEPGLDALFRLHRARWPGGTRFDRHESFHRDFARRAFDNGWLRLRIREADGKPIAARLGFRFCGVESGYQSGWDARYAAYSIGILLVAEAIHAAHADGMREYRFLRGGESYKYRFTNLDPGLETVLFTRTPGSVLATAGSMLAGSPASGVVRSVARRHV
jgi:CelD/BcsL family acetyltransferase involved in cellulose biosynthesis